MDIDKQIEELEEKLSELKELKKAEREAQKRAFVLEGYIECKEAPTAMPRKVPEDFRKISICLKYKNTKEADRLGIYYATGYRTYHYIEGWIVALGGGTRILNTPCEAKESEWLSIINGKIPSKFLQRWVNERIKG